MERLDFVHTLQVKTIGNRLFLAPVEEDKIQRILDVGTGTGICMVHQQLSNNHRCLLTSLGAIEVADLFPNAEVLSRLTLH